MAHPQNARFHGSTPYLAAVVHGGPGAAGEMAPVARTLSPICGILEPLQTATNLEGQIEELRLTLETHAACPVILIGYSWGAWLSTFVTARFPHLVRKLILISSGPLEARYTTQMNETRLSRLRALGLEDEWLTIIKGFANPQTAGKNHLLARLGRLASLADSFDPLPPEEEEEPCRPQGEIFQGVWDTAAAWRSDGRLLEMAGRVTCPVAAIHGDFDPHPAAGVQQPLARLLKDFRFILLKNCGHTPWLERQARDAFYEALQKECF